MLIKNARIKRPIQALFHSELTSRLDMECNNLERKMENAVWSVIKYKPKDGCSDAFKEALGRLADIMNKPDIVWSLIELDTGEIVQISRSPSRKRCRRKQNPSLFGSGNGRAAFFSKQIVLQKQNHLQRLT